MMSRALHSSGLVIIFVEDQKKDHFIHADISTFSSTVSAGKVFRAVCGDGIIIQPFLLFVCSSSSNLPKDRSGKVHT